MTKLTPRKSAFSESCGFPQGRAGGPWNPVKATSRVRVLEASEAGVPRGFAVFITRPWVITDVPHVGGSQAERTQAQQPSRAL